MHLLLPMPLFVVPIVILLVLTKTYQRSWHHVRIRDYVYLAATLLSGWLIGCIVVILFGLRFPGWGRQAIVFALSMPFPIVGVRMIREMIAEGLLVIERDKMRDAEPREQVLAYGGGRSFSCYLRVYNLSKGWKSRNIVGIIDDNIALNGRVIDGCPVLGTPSDVPALIKEYAITGIIVTAVLEEANRRGILAIARENGVWVNNWQWEEKAIDP
jgi:FlaA1/EpsC-like NDP-sugar epimerase